MVNKKFFLIFFLILFLTFAQTALAENTPQENNEEPSTTSIEETPSAKEEIKKATDTIKQPWNYKNQTLEQILNNPNIKKEIKLIAFEKAALDKKLNETLIDLAIKQEVINKTEKNFYMNDLGLYSWTKLKTKYYWGTASVYLTNHFDWLLGFSEYRKGDDLETKSLTIFSWYYWKTYGWQYCLTALPFVFWMFLFYPFTKTFKRNDGSIITIYELNYVTGFLQTIYDISKHYFFKFKKIRIIPFPTNWILYTPLIYAIAMGIPILNRTLQIITLEFLGVHWLWRSLILATMISFGPFFLKKYGEYRKRMKLEKDALEEQAAIEAMKIRINN
jgi:hypothetical protein